MAVPGSGLEWELMVPEAPVGALQAEVAPGIGTLDDKRIGIFWNRKPNGDIFLIKMGQLLKERFKDAKIVEFLPGNPNILRAAPDSSIKEAAEKCDVVILSTGD